jgi:hypothetical protein
MGQPVSGPPLVALVRAGRPVYEGHHFGHVIEREAAMKTVMLRTEIAADGVLHLSVPVDMPPGPAEVVVVVQSVPAMSPGLPGPPYPSDHGVWAGKLPDSDLATELAEMNQLWEKCLEFAE